MIKRHLQDLIQEYARTYPVITITGPRQAGKTTLAMMAFPDYDYCNLEHPETRKIAQEDPKSFFLQHPAPVIIDEIQRVPELLSYIQVMVDQSGKNGQFILTGSQNLQLNSSITQSLAGRTALVTLLPFSLAELQGTGYETLSREENLLHGFLPRIYDQNQEPVSAYRNYLQTYVERDVRQLINLKELGTFEKFLRLLAGRVGQLINMSSLSSETGVSVSTISKWLAVLEASYIIFRLNPYYENFNKRTIKSAKLYFVETGLVTYLLGIEDRMQLIRDPLLGGLFENMVVMECIKARLNKGLDPQLYFYRDSNHVEIDLLFKKGSEVIPVEIKSSLTYNKDFLKGIFHFVKLNGKITKGYLVYGGDQRFEPIKNVFVVGYQKTASIF